MGISLAGSTTRKVLSAFEDLEQELAAELAPPALEKRGAIAIGPAVEVPADQVFQVRDVGHERGRRPCAGRTTGPARRRAGWRPSRRRGCRPGAGPAREEIVRARARASSITARIAWLFCSSAGPVEVAEGLQVAPAGRLPLGDGHQQVVAQDLPQAAGSGGAPRPRATRRAAAPSPARGG